ncbi:hypothetical protein [Marivita sp.]|uniref:hypothetical protein n=1 Tax=Marivita sp. TaxID=2003365 RepID=UPI003F6BAEBD
MPSLLATSTVHPVWRDQDVGALMPAAVPSTRLDDAVGLALVQCAKKRMDSAMGCGGGTDYARLTFDTGGLRGLCFVAADEVARYLVAQGENAKAVMVKPAGGSDHYFTIVNNGNAQNSVVIDATWKQFQEGTADKPFCIAGKLGSIRFVFGRDSEIVDIYETGMTVLGQWDTYQCFPDP